MGKPIAFLLSFKRLLLSCRGQIRAASVCHFRCHADGFAQGGVGVDGFADVYGVAAHFYGQADFADEVAGIHADDGAAQEAVGGAVEEEFCKTFFGSVGDGAAAGCPGEDGFFKLDAFCLELIFGFAGPGNFRVGVGHTGDLQGVEGGLFTGGHFCSNVGFMDGFVGEHGLADDVADGEDVGYVGAHLGIYGYKTPVCDGNPGFVGGYLLTIGGAAYGDQDQVELFLFAGGVGDIDAAVFGGFGFCSGNAGVEQDAVEAVGVFLFPHFDEITVGSGHKTCTEFDYGDACPQAAVNGCHFETDDAATDDEHLFGDHAQFEGAGGVYYPGVVLGHEGEGNGLGAGGDDGVLEFDDLLFAIG